MLVRCRTSSFWSELGLVSSCSDVAGIAYIVGNDGEAFRLKFKSLKCPANK